MLVSQGCICSLGSTGFFFTTISGRKGNCLSIVLVSVSYSSVKFDLVCGVLPLI